MQVPYRKPGKYMIQKSDPLITGAKLTELEKELTKLKKIRPGAAAEVSRLAEMGDFSENVEYQLAKGRLRGINNAIFKIANQLNQAVVIKPQTQTNEVQIGHIVTIETENGPKTYQILGSAETNPGTGTISHNSPLGSALMDKKVGDVIKIKLTNKEIEYKIIEIK